MGIASWKRQLFFGKKCEARRACGDDATCPVLTINKVRKQDRRPSIVGKCHRMLRGTLAICGANAFSSQPHPGIVQNTSRLAAVFQRPLDCNIASGRCIPTATAFQVAAAFHVAAVFQATAVFQSAAVFQQPLYSNWTLYSNGHCIPIVRCIPAAAVSQVAAAFQWAAVF